MSWSKPDFKDISLSFEVTAYVNTDSQQKPGTDSQMPEAPTKK